MVDRRLALATALLVVSLDASSALAQPASPQLPAGFDPTAYLGQGDRYNCADFPSQAAAQAVLRADPSDPNQLDSNSAGIPGVASEANKAPKDFDPVPLP